MAARGLAGTPSERAVIFVDPAGTIPRMASLCTMPVATSATVPSPPTAITIRARLDAARAASVASSDEPTKVKVRSTADPSLRASDSAMAPAPRRLFRLMTAAYAVIEVGELASLGLRLADLLTKNLVGDVVGEPGGGRDQHQPENAAHSAAHHI